MERQRDLEKWIDQINRVCGKFRGNLLGGPFAGSIDEFHAHTMKLSTVNIVGAALSRTAHEIAQGDDAWFYTVFQLQGEAIMEQDGRQAILKPGDMMLIDAARPSLFRWPAAARQISLLLPRRNLEQSQTLSRVPCGQILEGSLPMVRLCHSLLRESLAAGTLSASESEAALNAVSSLLRPLLKANCPPRSRRDRQLDAIMAFIDVHIQSSNMRPEWVAAQNNISVRSLYRMFAARNLVVAQYIKNRRLDLCAQAICMPGNDEKLAGIGLTWGFADHSHFSTAFKQRFGMSPSAWRKHHQ